MIPYLTGTSALFSQDKTSVEQIGIINRSNGII